MEIQYFLALFVDYCKHFNKHHKNVDFINEERISCGYHRGRSNDMAKSGGQKVRNGTI